MNDVLLEIEFGDGRLGKEASEEFITTCMTLFAVAVIVTYEIIFSVCPQSAIHFYSL